MEVPFGEFRLINGRCLAGFALAGFMFTVAGCQSGDGATNLGLGLGGGTDKPKEVVLESELRAYCPPVTLREGTAVIRAYAKGGQDDPAKLSYQAAISDVTRDCKRADGMMTLNVAVAGRIVPGPAGAPASITMPIRVVVLRGEEVLYSQLHKYQVSTGPDAAQFVFNDPNVVIPIPEPNTIKVFAGYDEGPQKKGQ